MTACSEPGVEGCGRGCAEPALIPGFDFLSSFLRAGERLSLQSAEVLEGELLAITRAAK